MSSHLALVCARTLWIAALIALIGAGIADLRGSLFGLGAAHLFSDATVLALLSLGMFADAWWHAREAPHGSQ